MQRYYYSESVAEFLARPAEAILGTMDQVNEFDLTMDQRNAWLEEFDIMKSVLGTLGEDGQILFEYTIPRLGKRVDVVLLMRGVVFEELPRRKPGSHHCSDSRGDRGTEKRLLLGKSYL